VTSVSNFKSVDFIRDCDKFVTIMKFVTGRAGTPPPTPPYIYKSYTFLPILDVNQPLYFTKFYIGFGIILY